MLVWVAYVKFKRFVGYKKNFLCAHDETLRDSILSLSLSLSQVESPH